MWWTPSNGLLTLLGFLTAAILFLVYHYAYWARRKVPYLRPWFFVGNLGGMLRMNKSPAEFIQDLYEHPRSVDQPIVGIFMFHKPALLIRSPELVKRILIKDFSKFHNRYSNSDYNGDPMGSQNIFFLKNPMWKQVRLKLSPFFSSAKMKHMFCLIEEIGRNLNDHLMSLSRQKHCDSEGFIVELKELCSLFATDVIASVAYGVEANSFKDPNGDFRRNGRAVFDFNIKRGIEFVLVFFLPQLVPVLGFKIVPPEPTKFLRSTINYVMAQREKSGLCRNDLIDILLELKASTQMSNDLLVAQAALFFTAGFETSSSTMSFALYELAKRMDLQMRIRSEIKQALIQNEGKVTQRMIESLEYMNMVICETLRLYPPLPFLDRDCTVGDEGYSLKPFHDVTITNGTPIYVPVYGLHMDPKYFKDPELFDPERFSPENKKNIIPYTYMPFGLGPHACIGERLGVMQTKIGLTYFLLNHYVRTCSRTQKHMQINRKSVIVQAEEGIYLEIVADPLIK